MSQKTQQGLGPGPSNPFEYEEDDVPPGERITPVDSERGRMLAKAAEAALREARRSSAPPVAPVEQPTSNHSPTDAPVTVDVEAGAEADQNGGWESVRSRSDFDTVPGGGVNRESGGREVARAYVSPKTPIQLKEGRLALISVDVDPEASADSRSFPTEKALRAASIIPPPMSTVRPVARRRSWAPYVIAAATAGLLSATIAYVVEAEKSPLVKTDGGALKTGIAATSPPAPHADSPVTTTGSGPSNAPLGAAAAVSGAPLSSSAATNAAQGSVPPGAVPPVNQPSSGELSQKNEPNKKVGNKPSAPPINKPEPAATSAATKPAGTSAKSGSGSSAKSGSGDVWLE